MPKVQKGKGGGKGSKKGSKDKKWRSGAAKHEPLEKQIFKELNPGNLKKPKAEGKQAMRTDDDDDVSEKKAFHDEKISRKVLQQVHEQQAEVAAEMKGAFDNEDFPALGFAASNPLKQQGPQSTAARVASRLTKQAAEDDDDEDELHDAEDDEVEDVEVDEEDERQLEMLMPSKTVERRTLADIIMDKIREKEQGAAAAAASGAGAGATAAAAAGEQKKPDNKAAAEELKRRQDPKLLEAYAKVARFMSYYSSGKVPKAFSVIPNLKNWEEILLLTEPDNWTAQAVFRATKLFTSNLNEKMAQRFYSLVLLPRVRQDIGEHKKLNHHLYQAVKKTLFKPMAFFRGIILPLSQEDCTAREAIILASILAKCSIPVLHAAAAVLKMSELPFSPAVTYLIKTLLNKKYSLPSQVIDAMVRHFVRHIDDEGDFPVVWHQSLLVFVQRYKYHLLPDQKEALKNLLRLKPHKGITDEIRRELLAPEPLSMAGSGAFAGSVAASRRGSVSSVAAGGAGMGLPFALTMGGAGSGAGSAFGGAGVSVVFAGKGAGGSSSGGRGGSQQGRRTSSKGAKGGKGAKKGVVDMDEDDE